MLRELLTDHPESVRWPDSLERALGTRGFAREVQRRALARAREKGLDGDRPARARAGATTCRPTWRPVSSSSSTSTTSTTVGAIDYADLIRRATIEAAATTATSCGRPTARLRRRVPGHRPRPGRAAPGAGRRRPQPDRRRRPAPVDLRLPRRRGARHPRLPGARSRAPTARPRGWSPCAPPAASDPDSCSSRQRVAARLALPGVIPPEANAGLPRAGQAEARPGLGDGHVDVRTFDSDAGRGRAPRRPAAPRPPRGRRRLGRDGGPRPIGPDVDPAAAPFAARGRGCPVEVAADEIPLVRDPAVLPLLDGAARRGQPRQRRPRPRRPPPTPTGPRPCSSAPSAVSMPATSAGSPARFAPARRPRPTTPTGRRRPRATSCAPAVVEPGLPRRARGCRDRPRPCPGAICCARARTTLEERRVGRGGALAALVSGRGGRPGCGTRSSTAVGRPGWPTATSTRSARSSRSAARAEEQRVHLGVARPSWPRCRPSRSPPTPSPTGAPAARRTPADRSPLQGPRVAAGRRRPRPAGRLARPAPAHHAAAGRPDRPRRAGPADHRPGAPAGGAPALLRRLHPRPPDDSSSPPWPRPTTTASSPRAFSTSSGATDALPSWAARPGRCRSPGWSASCGAPLPTPTSRSRCAPPPPADWHVWPPRCRRPTRPWWGTRAASRSATPLRDPDQPVPVSASVVEGARRLPDPVVPRA